MTLIPPIPLFCKQNKQSIIQTHRTFLCSYIISMASPGNFPYRTYPPGRPATRSLTRKESPQGEPGQPQQPKQPNQPGEQEQQGKQEKRGQPASTALHKQLASKGRQANQYQKGGHRQPKGFIATVGLLKTPKKAGPNWEEHL